MMPRPGKEMPSLRQVFVKPAKPSRQRFPQLAAGDAADLAPLHVAADITVAAIGLQDAVRALEQQQQRLFVRVQPLERAVEGGKGNTLGEAGVKARRQRWSQRWNGMAPIGLELGLKLPDLAAHARLVTR
jgi:hypothetical protein